MASQQNHLHPYATIRAASVLNLLLGTWLYISPWVFGSYATPEVWNSGAVGGMIATLAALRIAHPSRQRWTNWVNSVLAVWIIASPWVYGYVPDTARLVNNLCVGGAVLIIAALSGSLTASRHF